VLKLYCEIKSASNRHCSIATYVALYLLSTTSQSSVKFGKPIDNLPSFYTAAYNYPTTPGKLLKYQQLPEEIDGATV